jgi:hypothetical protein
MRSYPTALQWFQVANAPKVPKAEFDAVLSALLKAPAPLTTIERKRKPKAGAPRKAKKRA